MSILSALPIVGDLIGAASQRQANRENRLMQERFASEGIRMRVADAKAAGLHPLFALGGNVPSYSPSAQPIFDGGSLGQNLARAATQFSAEERELRLAQLEAVRAGTARDYAQAAAFASEAARARQEQNVSNPVATSFPVSVPGQDGSARFWDGVKVPGTGLSEPAELPPLAHSPRYLNPEGPKPGFRQWYVPGLGEVILPDASNMSEALESLENTVLQGAVASANLIHYGPAKLAQLRKWARSQGRDWWSDPVGSFIDWNWPGRK